jgi:hypothetical protein
VGLTMPCHMLKTLSDDKGMCRRGAKGQAQGRCHVTACTLSSTFHRHAISRDERSLCADPLVRLVVC